ncbi:MAG: tryptophan-rich sensory protein [Anaerolineae bacterium]
MNAVLRQIIVVVTYVVTLVINGMASSGALGGTPTGEVSNAYPIYFVPANLTFAIWGVIYTALTAFVIYQALPSQRDNPLIKRITWPFVISNFANTVWLVLFQSLQFVLSVPVMLLILGMLLTIYLRMGMGQAVSRATYWLVQVPFSIYLGWITIATIANVSQTLYAAGYTELGLGGPVWAAIMIAVGTVIISAVIVHGRGNIPYALTTVWAIIGIVIAQGPRSTLVGGTAIAAIAVILAVLVYSRWQRQQAGDNSTRLQRAAS